MDAELQQNAADSNGAKAVAALEHLTGPCRGTVTWLWQPLVNLWLSPEGYIHVFVAEAGQAAGNPVARLRRAENSYVIEAVEGRSLWVNGHRVSSRLLKHGDTIEFGENGPISRCYLYDGNHRIHESVGDILSDTAAYFRSSRQPLMKKLFGSCGQALRRLTVRTTILFRVGVLVILATLAALAYQQSRINALLQTRLESGVDELERFSRTLARLREETPTPAELEALSLELRGRMATTAERVAEIERLSGASATVIAQSMASVPFLQGAYGFRETQSGRMLRHVLDEDGQRLILPNGLPVLSLDGDGPIAERQFTGTGFVVAGDNILVTNRHVGLPWEGDANINAMTARGLEPVMIRFIAYFPGAADPVDVTLLRASDDADIALLRIAETAVGVAGLRLADGPPTPGDDVIVMGYPTGLRSMLAQAGEVFVKDLRQSEEIDFWSVAVRLAGAGRIIPLASRGIVGRASAETIVFDADTTHGGSGGPVLDVDGAVLAVTAAILPEYGGSNLGVPAERVRALLDAVQAEQM